MNVNELYEKIRKGEIDVNNQSLFFKIFIEGFLQSLNDTIKIRNKTIPHYIPQTGDETMMVEIKGKDVTANDTEVTNENYIYSVSPRCSVQPKGISIIADQVSSPYANGTFEFDYEDVIAMFSAEFRRIPLKMSFELTYLVDSYTDYLELVQQIVSKLLFIRNYSISYMGRSIGCSYQVPTDFDVEYDVEFDLANQEDRHKKLNLTIEVETNFPVYAGETAIPADRIITKYKSDIIINERTIQ